MNLTDHFPKASKSFLDANRHLFGGGNARLQVDGTHVSELAERIAEKDLQLACERWLEGIGYRRMTPANAVDMKQTRGWFGHLFNPKGNPFLPDLFIFDAACERLLCVELKTHEDYRPGQRQMIDRGQWHLARSVHEFCGIVKNWERKETTDEGKTN